MAEEFINLACRKCGGPIQLERIEPKDMPPPPGALLAIAPDPPDEWQGWEWICGQCGDVVGVSYDYGTIDLGLVE